MGLFSWLSGHSGGGKEVPDCPWDRKPSIYEHIRAHIVPGEKGLRAEGQNLPDDERIASRSKLRWASGALDGAWSHHGGEAAKKEVGELVGLFKAYSSSPTAANKLKLYNHVLEHHTIDSIDSLLEKLGGIAGLDLRRVYELARSFAMEAPDREPVKLGIAILGRFRQEQDRDIFFTLARHEEFTLYCAVALQGVSPNLERDLWEVAKQVDGWGRIHVVERLSQTDNPGIKDWLLREGYKNSVMYEYLACICARAGNLLAALESDGVDDELLDGASEIIDALIMGGPAEDLNDYEDGPGAILTFVRHMRTRASKLGHLLTVRSIRDWLLNPKADWEAREKKGWSAGNREQIVSWCNEIISRPSWREMTLRGLRSDDEARFHEADQAAQIFGIDTWEYHWGRLQQSPGEGGRWWHVMRLCDDVRIAEVLTLAERTLPLDEIASGPGDSLGLGEEYRAHNCLDFILQDLGRFPGQGVSLVKAGLRSPVIRCRNMALRTLSGWGKANWPAGVEASLELAISEEPEEDVRLAMARVLNGEPFDVSGE